MEHNLEQDMHDAGWFVDKVRNSPRYAQNLYAALCNNAFQKVEVMPILKDEVWTCTWRYAGGVVAELRDQGEDYMDYYCSGIRGGINFASDHTDEHEFAGEGHVTDEIREDFKQLGWQVVEDYYDDNGI